MKAILDQILNIIWICGDWIIVSKEW